MSHSHICRLLQLPPCYLARGISFSSVFFSRASLARAWSVNIRTNLISLADSCARFFLPLLCHKGTTSLAKRICSLQTRFCKERKFLAKLIKMGVTWSSYIDKRKEKKELKRFVADCNSSFFYGKTKKKNLSLLHTPWKMKTELKKRINPNWLSVATSQLLCNSAEPQNLINIPFRLHAQSFVWNCNSLKAGFYVH